MMGFPTTDSYDSFWSYERILKPLRNPKLFCPLPPIKIEIPERLEDEESASVSELHSVLDDGSDDEEDDSDDDSYGSDDDDLTLVDNEKNPPTQQESYMKLFSLSADIEGHKRIKHIEILRDAISEPNTPYDPAAVPSGQSNVKYHFVYDFELGKKNGLDLWAAYHIYRSLKSESGKDALVRTWSICFEGKYSEFMSGMSANSLSTKVSDLLLIYPGLDTETFLKKHYSYLLMSIYKMSLKFIRKIFHSGKWAFYPCMPSIRERVMLPVKGHSFVSDLKYNPFKYWEYPLGDSIQEIWSEWSYGLYGKPCVRKVEMERYDFNFAISSNEREAAHLHVPFNFQCPIREQIIKFITYCAKFSIDEKQRDKVQLYIDFLQAFIYFNNMSIEKSVEFIPKHFKNITAMDFTLMDELYDQATLSKIIFGAGSGFA